MADYLFVTWDGGGNVPPALTLARRLQDRGHDVRVLGHPSQEASVEAAGLPFRAYPTVRPFTGAETHSLPRLVALFTDRRLADDVAAEIDRARPDVVVVDCLLLPALKAGARSGVPVVSLEHTFDGYVRGGWARGPIGMVARLKGVAPTRTWDAAALSLVASLPSLDPAYDGQRPGNRVWTGPLVEHPAPRDRSGRPPKVLVSLSTFAYPGMVDTLQRVLDGLATLDVPAVVTTGPAVDPARLRAPANVEVHRFLPHDELLPHVSLVVGHGGHSTTMRALAHGVPLLVLPLHPLLDQPMVGKRVEAAGAGRVLPRKAPPEQVASAVRDLVHDGPHRAAATRLAEEIRATGGADGAADLLEELADHPSPQRLG